MCTPRMTSCFWCVSISLHERTQQRFNAITVYKMRLSIKFQCFHFLKFTQDKILQATYFSNSSVASYHYADLITIAAARFFSIFLYRTLNSDWTHWSYPRFKGGLLLISVSKSWWKTLNYGRTVSKWTCSERRGNHILY